MILSGDKSAAGSYIEGLDILSNMRLCANVPGQFAVQTALGGYQSINELILPGGRLHEQRDLAWELITSIPGISCVKPKGAIYMFPRLDPDFYPVKNDTQLILELLNEAKILLVQGSAFNIKDNNHVRLVFLPQTDVLAKAAAEIGNFLSRREQRLASVG